ncbi:hypothetical protein J6590_031081 [Homalodisca vitripennis]|nr:hypothetical protein J6590_031081 [Homalodisca vitripennis]
MSDQMMFDQKVSFDVASRRRSATSVMYQRDCLQGGRVCLQCSQRVFTTRSPDLAAWPAYTPTTGRTEYVTTANRIKTWAISKALNEDLSILIDITSEE